MKFCIPHRVSLVLAIERLPVSWSSLRIPNPSVACPLCQAYTQSGEEFEKALSHWITRGRNNPDFLMTDTKDNEDSTDKKDSDNMNYSTQKKNREKLRAEANRRIVNQLTDGGTKGPTKRSNGLSTKDKPTKKPNHLRLV